MGESIPVWSGPEDEQKPNKKNLELKINFSF